MKTLSRLAIEHATRAAFEDLLSHGVMFDSDIIDKAQNLLGELLSSQVEITPDNDRVYIEKERRIHCVAKEWTTYYVTQSEYEDALRDCGGEEAEAITLLVGAGKLKRESHGDHSMDIQEVVAEFDVEYSPT
ncbi:hypothetical protein [Enterovibrio coralii]|uniref:Uncharacterized protein n=1 Tax=Enterovibrio coralii TaxID=294935 RepID=A0A135I8N3_9GAMM|nr:hypothetical protein [Enterovibrio coralii]KXF81816.1 hypothetical protein ATN88_20135 [Enterovibrio coralii]